MIRLAMALSTFSGKMDEYVCCTEDGFDGRTDSWSSSYISQMEPTVFYLLENYDDDLEVVLLCSKETYAIINGVEKDSIEFFVDRVNERAKALNKKEVEFKKILLDKDDSIPGIRETARHIRDNTKIDSDDNKFWIDIHGGFRDISTSFNAIISLLKVYGIRTDKVVTVQWAEGRTSKIKDVTESFRIFDFVSGMNEFVQYGSAETLLAFDNEFIDKSILESIKVISDGTKLCDPLLYKKGLIELGKRLAESKKQGKYTDLFERYIKDDYGQLLDKPTNIGIIKRCYRKKMYQQALTFIESLMPESFVNNKILFANPNEMDKVSRLQEEQGDKTNNCSENAFLINNFIYNIQFREGNFGNKKFNQQVLEVIKDPSNLIKDFISDGDTVYIKRKGTNKKLGEIFVYTELKSEYHNAAGKLLRLHKALKNCRNMTNHAQENQNLRPDINDIDKALSYYIELAEVVFDPQNREVVSHDFKESILYEKKKSDNEENKDRHGYDFSSNGYNTFGEALKNVDISRMEKVSQEEMLEVGSNHWMVIAKKGKGAKKKIRLEGELENGELAIIPGSYFDENENLDDYIGKECEVIIDRIQDGKYICSIRKEM